jgi:dihydrofolate reductase
MRWNLVDELTLLIHPLILGSGRRLFPHEGAFAALDLRHAKTTGNGVVIVTYQPANNGKEIKNGNPKSLFKFWWQLRRSV